MANQILQTLLFNIESNTAQLKQGLDQAKGQISSFGKGISQVGNLLKGAFAATAIIGAAREVFEFGQELEGIRDKIENLGYTMDTAFSTGKAKAIADVFEVDIDKVITAANATAKQFGISFNEALDLTQKGLALAGTESLKYLKAIEANSASYSESGASAEEYFTVVTNGYRTSSDWESKIKGNLKDQSTSWNELTSNMTEGQLVQQRLIDSTAELNAVFTNLFDGSGDGIDKLKIGFNEIIVYSFKAMKQGIIDVTNYFITLYNNSILFRTVIEAVVLNFKILWNVVKAIGTTLFDIGATFGSLIQAVLTGNFSEIPNIIKKGFTDVLSNTKDFAINIATAFKDSAQAIFSNQPIELISESEAVKQGVIAGNAIRKGIGKVYATVNPRSNISDVNIGQASLKQPTKFNEESIDNKKLQDDLASISEQTTVVQSQWDELDAQFNTTLSGTLVDGLDAAGGAIGSFGESASSSFESFVGSMLNGIKKIINGLLATSIAGMIAGESSKGIVGLAVAALGIAAITALFQSQVSGKYANGGVTQGAISLVGERGPELIHAPANSRVYNAFQTDRMLGNTGNGGMSVMSMLRGEDIYFSYNEVARRRKGSKG